MPEGLSPVPEEIRSEYAKSEKTKRELEGMRSGLDPEVIDAAVAKSNEVSDRNAEKAKEYAAENLDKLIPDAKKEMQSDISRISASLKRHHDKNAEIIETGMFNGATVEPRDIREAKAIDSYYVRDGKQLTGNHLDTLRDAAKAEAEAAGKEINLGAQSSGEQGADTRESEPK